MTIICVATSSVSWRFLEQAVELVTGPDRRQQLEKERFRKGLLGANEDPGGEDRT